LLLLMIVLLRTNKPTNEPGPGTSAAPCVTPAFRASTQLRSVRGSGSGSRGAERWEAGGGGGGGGDSNTACVRIQCRRQKPDRRDEGHTHTHCCTVLWHTHRHTHILSLSLSPSPSLYLCMSLCLFLSLAHSHSHSLCLSLALSLSLSRTMHMLTSSIVCCSCADVARSFSKRASRSATAFCSDTALLPAWCVCVCTFVCVCVCGSVGRWVGLCGLHPPPPSVKRTRGGNTTYNMEHCALAFFSSSKHANKRTCHTRRPTQT
jgi:hypothetical protein